MASREKSRSVSTLNRLIFLAILIPLAVIGVAYFLSPNSPFHTDNARPAPITIGVIQKQYKIETATVTSSTLVNGYTNSLLPFSKDEYSYQVVVTMTAGIDMSVLKDSDITVTGDSVTVKLPPPTLLRTEHSGQVISHNQEVLSGFSANKNLQDQIESEGQNRVVKTVLEQGELMRQARTNAEDEMRNLIQQLGYKNVTFVQSDTTPGPSPSPSGPPR